MCRPAAKIPMMLTNARKISAARLAKHIDVIATMARLSAAWKPRPPFPKGSAQFVLGEAVVALPLGDVIDFAKERARLEGDSEEGTGRNRPLRRQAVERAVRRQEGAGRGAGLSSGKSAPRAAALAARLRDAIGRLAKKKKKKKRGGGGGRGLTLSRARLHRMVQL